MSNVRAIFALLIVIIACASAWKSCGEVPFCNRLRRDIPVERYSLESVQFSESSVSGKLQRDGQDGASVQVVVTALQDDIFRVVIDDVSPTTPPRHRVPEALDGEPQKSFLSLRREQNETITLQNGNAEAIIYKSPFKIEFYNNKRIVSIVNANQRLVFEQGRPNRAVALDINFPGAQRAYGLPERAERLALKTTINQDPYRHFNVDYGYYRLESTESLYGTIPVLYAHAETHSSGVFWLNSAQTFVELAASPDVIDAFFMSETGVIDLFVLTGPTLPKAVKQYAKLTGVAPLPQYFTLAYHQSRYSYMTQDEVKEVVNRFDEEKMPVDVVWLDIDYALDKKYFTWDPIRFSDPIGLQNSLSASGRKLVAIIDPHIKNETGYFLHDTATANNYYVKNPDGSDYVGDCWPGSSSYIDFTNQNASDYVASLYQTVETFQSNDVHIWNDMNEPAVFYKNPHDEYEFEKTMPLDSVHFNNYEHRDIHNMYGFLQTIATRKGMLARPTNTGRPFILTRSHFAGIQRYAAVWTGDNGATWGYLQYSLPMCLTEALAGVSFCGADIGGFIGIPDDELYQRWYQAGAWLPFFRGHSAIDVPRREPYRYPQVVKNRLRRALNQRYAHLPEWYTLFYEHERTGEPVIRPITYHYPQDGDALSLDTEILVGANILVAPVLTPGTTHLNVYLPGGPKEIWYNIDEQYRPYRGVGYQVLRVNINSTPVFYRGGGIITRKDTPRPSSVATYADPFTLYIAPDIKGHASGSLYVDDYETFDYQASNENYVYSQVTFSNGKIQLNVLNESKYSKSASITKIVILNVTDNKYKKAILQGDVKGHIKLSYDKATTTLTLSNIELKPNTPFTIILK